ncbi:MAG: hypothetical protein ACRDWD_14730, partial [Acidimicrobiia bacterium]
AVLGRLRQEDPLPGEDLLGARVDPQAKPLARRRSLFDPTTCTTPKATRDWSQSRFSTYSPNPGSSACVSTAFSRPPIVSPGSG